MKTFISMYCLVIERCVSTEGSRAHEWHILEPCFRRRRNRGIDKILPPSSTKHKRRQVSAILNSPFNLPHQNIYLQDCCDYIKIIYSAQNDLTGCSLAYLIALQWQLALLDWIANTLSCILEWILHWLVSEVLGVLNLLTKKRNRERFKRWPDSYMCFLCVFYVKGGT